MNDIPMEDNFEDILGKAMRGNGLSDEILEFLTGVPVDKINDLLEAKLDVEALRKLAAPLGLDSATLVERAEGSWRPAPVEIKGLSQFNTPFDDMTVNYYLVWDEASKEAAIFDTGTTAKEGLTLVDELGLKLKYMFISHSHLDHIIDRESVEAHSPELETYVGAFEPVEGASRFLPGTSFQLGALEIETRLTKGHSPGGTTYIVKGLERQLAIAGDALFAQSMGGGMISHFDALATNRSEIFCLSDDTVLCPGHGPMSSIGEEKAHNPFFPEFK